ncbi:uncharacterized protein M437DRAFT_70481 [Aureobasidium melanogenum CBS 110374]|uniref:Uncharacterized protein n=1 Tax=Aureobasidium melanogenum (strain CBS 110374) TaxID=1043003 RepID=A0A074VFR3_AURM1|nr:uncharacterized protein M437DRAFT_70481 [Aureobasidium melanogenum CBS 110374]KEQ57829.1 hypothetical protein M437DRAFT_70481 [Aureobasidium melanogenum CBS 110374]
MVCLCTRLSKRDYGSLTDDEACTGRKETAVSTLTQPQIYLLDEAARSTEPRRLQLRQSRQSVRAKRVQVMANQAPSAKRPRTSSIIVSAVGSVPRGATKTGKTVTRPGHTIVRHPLKNLGMNQTSRTEEDICQQETSLVSPVTSICLTEDLNGSQESERSMHSGLSQKTVQNISSMVGTISSHQRSWIESTCIFTALLGSKPSGWTVANHSSEAVESTLANTFVQVQVSILQHQIFNKLLAYAANSLWAGKHLGSSENLTKLRRHGSGASEFVRAAGNAASILLLVPPSWWEHLTSFLLQS